MATKSKTKRSTSKTKPQASTESLPEANTVSVPTNYVEASYFGHRSLEDFEIWLSTLMGGTDWERQVDAFSDETC